MSAGPPGHIRNPLALAEAKRRGWGPSAPALTDAAAMIGQPAFVEATPGAVAALERELGLARRTWSGPAGAVSTPQLPPGVVVETPATPAETGNTTSTGIAPEPISPAGNHHARDMSAVELASFERIHGIQR